MANTLTAQQAPTTAPNQGTNYDAYNKAINNFVFTNKRPPNATELAQISNTALPGAGTPGAANTVGGSPTSNTILNTALGQVANFADQPSYSSQLKTANAQSAQDLGLPQLQENYLGMLDPTKATPAGFNDSYTAAVNDFTNSPTTDPAELQAKVNKIGALGVENETGMQQFTIQKAIAAQRLSQAMDLYSKAQEMNAAGLTLDKQSKESVANMLFQAADAKRNIDEQAANFTGTFNGQPTVAGQLAASQIGKNRVDSVANFLPYTGDVESASAAVNSLLGGGSTSPASGFRTDRNNNPTAMTTDVARTAGLVEGKDYVQGDPFQTGNGQTLYTAKLLGDPIQTTIKAIDQGGFTTQSGQNRWSYTQNIPGANNADWAKLNNDQKAAVVAQMYKNEGGSGAIFNQGNSSANAGSALLKKPFTAQDVQALAQSTGLPIAEVGKYKNLDEFSKAHPGAQVMNAAQQTKANALQNVSPILDTYQKLSQKINTADSPEKQVDNMVKNLPVGIKTALTVNAISKGMNLNQYLRSFDFNDLPNGISNILTRDNPDLAEYAGLKGTLGQLVKAFGDTGQLSEGDLQRARSLLPDPFDSKSTANGKLTQLTTLINKAQSSLTGNYQPANSSNGAIQGKTSSGLSYTVTP